ncbi:non-heme iron oxygenase ferredoxin subunit [Actinomyces sp. zg-332]|uniref:non-heme iron oxygenase ferredoxin subunit n=1 Tax=Actinomyces sp. zg-332 TaxID=2708340 RepID=UPI00141E16D1|nr:non-heme iron oxygenase ferredoxin subunit [Actinomyces sp. zg-332]QPK94584.1 non-heme iron oxygenase ferredoxin subunit [Actinomyces sp. zg-332]
MAFIKVAETVDFAPEEAICVEVQNSLGQELKIAVICDSEGDFYAIDDTCTHGQVSLSEGEISSKCVQCWAHGAEFDLCTGEATLPATEAVKVYNIRLEGTDILVDVDKSEEK